MDGTLAFPETWLAIHLSSPLNLFSIKLEIILWPFMDIPLHFPKDHLFHLIEYLGLHFYKKLKK